MTSNTWPQPAPAHFNIEERQLWDFLAPRCAPNAPLLAVRLESAVSGFHAVRKAAKAGVRLDADTIGGLLGNSYAFLEESGICRSARAVALRWAQGADEL